MSERDQALLESVRTHRDRLGAALAFGSLGSRRQLPSLTRRLIGGVVVAAIACAACVGVGFVSSILAANAAATSPTPASSPPAGEATPAPTTEGPTP
jgi:hypothetical protein